ncbi:hypothetical protein WR25_04255 [Diploscapter pachys]|uniref:CC domain-containing protein n=1 Tax=Diploscapter pachys TaxID=2018661 RepID=A0A2A2K1G3_9BILA|nr:hypothetical protein WR25_04255 [Diploscapter pachys]
MFAFVFLLSTIFSVLAQYGPQPTQGPVNPQLCPQGMTVTSAYGTTCMNGGYYFNGVCCNLPQVQTQQCPAGYSASPSTNGACNSGAFYYQGACCTPLGRK